MGQYSSPTLKIKELLHEGSLLSPPPLPCRVPEGTCTPDPRDGVADGVLGRWVRVTVGWHPAGWHGVGYNIRTTGSVADNGRILIVLLPLLLLSLRPGLLSIRGMLPTINTSVSKIKVRRRQVLVLHKNFIFFLSLKETR